jgi:hypothetical protein
MASGTHASTLRRAAAFAYRWLVGAGYVWDWLLAAVLVWINFNIPGTYIPAVDRLYWPDDPAFRCGTAGAQASDTRPRASLRQLCVLPRELPCS